MLNKRNRTLVHPRRPLTAPVAAFVEEMGVVMETDGHSRIAGRMVGLLLVTEGDTSLDDVAELLGVSKPSVSINARLLEQKGVLQRAGHVGDRRDFYRIADDVFRRTMEQRLARLCRLRDVVSSARSTVAATSPSVRSRLENFASACDHIRRVTEEALEHRRDIRAEGSHRQERAVAPIRNRPVAKGRAR